MGGMDDPEALAEQFMAEMRKRESKIQAQEEGREDVKDVKTWKKIEEGTEEEKRMVQVVLETVDKLKEKRDMTFNEVKLTLMIEDPRDAERRREMGIEVRRKTNETRTRGDEDARVKWKGTMRSHETNPRKEHERKERWRYKRMQHVELTVSNAKRGRKNCRRWRAACPVMTSAKHWCKSRTDTYRQIHWHSRC